MAREPSEIVAMRRDLGQQLTRARVAAGLTQKELAERIPYQRSSVSHLEAGRQGVPRTAWERIDALLGTNGTLIAAFDAVAAAKAAWASTGRRSPGSAIAIVEDVFGPEKPAKGGTAPGDARHAALQWLVSDSFPGPAICVPAAVNGARRVGRTDVKALHAARHHLKMVDNQHGGAAAFPLMTQYARHDAMPLLRGRYDDSTGRALLRTAAQLVLDAGWAAYDADAQPFARRSMLAALRLADAAGDRLFGGRVLAALAHQSLHVGRRREAVDLAQASLCGTTGVAGASAIAMFESMIACASAAIGDRRLCEAALSRADRALDRTNSSDAEPSWLDFDRGGLAGHAARAYRDLGLPGRARQYAEEAVSLCRPDHVRTQVQRNAILAAALADAGEIDHACAVGQQLITQAEPLRSVLVLSDMRQLDVRLAGTTHGAGLRRQTQELTLAIQENGRRLRT